MIHFIRFLIIFRLDRNQQEEINDLQDRTQELETALNDANTRINVLETDLVARVQHLETDMGTVCEKVHVERSTQGRGWMNFG